MDGADELNELLAEQRAYYRVIAPDYERYGLADVDGGVDLEQALERFDARGEVLEMACGPGFWTRRLTQTAASLTAVDASPEMIARAAAAVEGAAVPVRFQQADLFEWRPERRYDAVVFGFWLSHVPLDRFDAFWATVADSLVDGGRVFFADDAHRSPDELAFGADAEVVRRRLDDGSLHRVVKVPHTPASLQARLDRLGWAITVTATRGPFYWGAGGRG